MSNEQKELPQTDRKNKINCFVLDDKRKKLLLTQKHNRNIGLVLFKMSVGALLKASDVQLSVRFHPFINALVYKDAWVWHQWISKSNFIFIALFIQYFKLYCNKKPPMPPNTFPYRFIYTDMCLGCKIHWKCITIAMHIITYW